MSITSRSANVASRSIVMAQMYAGAISQGAMNSVITIQRPAAGSFDESTRLYTKPPVADVYPLGDDPGIAGLTPATGSSQSDLGDEPTYYSTVTCRIPLGSATPRIDDVISVVSNPDVNFVGRQFRVTDVPSGGRITASIEMQARGIAPSKQWS